jgi:hypothetical protein
LTDYSASSINTEGEFDHYDGHDEPSLEEDAAALHALLTDQGLVIDPYSIAMTSIAQILQWARYEYSGNLNDREFQILDAVSTVLHTLDPDLTVIHLPELVAQ